jgi:hypothetical protein
MKGKDSQVESTASTPRAEPASRKAFPSNRGRATLIAAGAALLFLAWQLMRPAAVDPELQGTWQLDFAEAGQSSSLVWEIGDGRYGLTTETEESGSFTAADGRWRSVTRGGRAFSGTYEISGPNAMTTTGGPFGNVEWTRKSPGRTPGSPGPLDPRWVGRWGGTTSSRKASHALSLDIHPDGVYSLKRRILERGKIFASDGHYRIAPERGAPLAGSYYFHGEDAVAISGPPGAGLWSKTAPN